MTSPLDFWSVISATDLLVQVWPTVVVLGFFLARRKRLMRKPLFVPLALGAGFASQYLALYVLGFLANHWMQQFDPDIQVLWLVAPFATAFIMDIVVPLIVVWLLYRIWVNNRPEEVRA